MKRIFLICLALSGCVSRAQRVKDIMAINSQIYDTAEAFEIQLGLDRAFKKRFEDQEKRIEALEQFMEDSKSRQSRSEPYIDLKPGETWDPQKVPNEGLKFNIGNGEVLEIDTNTKFNPQDVLEIKVEGDPK